MKVRNATIKDTEKIYNLIIEGETEGLLLRRTKQEIKQRIKEEGVFVAEINEEIIGVSILDYYSKRLSELRSLFVKKEYRKNGVGSELVKEVFKKAKEKKVKELLTITKKELESWFVTHGFDKDGHNLKVALFRKI